MLKYIKTDKCPKCGCSLIIEETTEVNMFDKNKYREHCYGGRWETRKFSCGCKIEYCPNFSREEIKDECANSEEYIKRENQRKTFKEAVINFIDSYKNTNEKDRNIMKDKMNFSIWW